MGGKAWLTLAFLSRASARLSAASEVGMFLSREMAKTRLVVSKISLVFDLARSAMSPPLASHATWMMPPALIM